MTTRQQKPIARARRGFGLVELIIAITIISTGVLGMAMISATVAQQARGGSMQANAANLAITRFEGYRATPCASLSVPSNGTVTTNGVTENWKLLTGGSTNAAVSTVLMIDTVSYYTKSGLSKRGYRSMKYCP
jgi:prepilin-type N-terminal cleavage/methylation domain-containing protein